MEKKNPFLAASFICGATAFITIYLVVPPVILGALGILFAILSKGREVKTKTAAKLSILIGSSAIICSIFVTVVSLYLVLSIPEYHEQLNQMSKNIYGVSYDEMQKEMQKSFQNKFPSY